MTIPLPNARQVIRRTRSAFRQGSLSDLKQLKDALAWGNFLDSQHQRLFLADVFHRLALEDFQKIPYHCARSISPDDYCCGAEDDKTSSLLYWVEISRREISLPQPSIRREWNKSPFRTQLIRDAQGILPTLRRQVIWLSDLGIQNPENHDPHILMAMLGRLNQQLTTNRPVIIYTVEVERIYQPTYVDAGYAYFWRAGTESCKHGMTRSLVDNGSGYREWIAPKEKIKVVDAWPLPPVKVSLKEGDLPDNFWLGCRQEIITRRNSLGL